jgi:hypothetical protein
MLRFQILLVSPCMVAVAIYGLCLPVIFGAILTPAPDTVEECSACLPRGVTLDTCFRRNSWDDPQTLTVRDQLRALGAYCRNGAIYGEDELPVRFYIPRRSPRYVGSPAVADLMAWEREDKEIAVRKEGRHLIVLWPVDRPKP